MGFRDMALFNQAMLAKQGWRLMIRPNSLSSRLLKGKYYPRSDFLSSTRKKKSSETWKAILFCRKSLETGLIRRIGLGNSVNIWEDNWIPGIKTFKPRVRLPTASGNMVHDLFQDDTRSWNE